MGSLLIGFLGFDMISQEWSINMLSSVGNHGCVFQTWAILTPLKPVGIVLVQEPVPPSFHGGLA